MDPRERPGQPSDAEAFQRRRRGRNIALAVVLAALVVLFYVLTFVRFGGN